MFVHSSLSNPGAQRLVFQPSLPWLVGFRGLINWAHVIQVMRNNWFRENKQGVSLKSGLRRSWIRMTAFSCGLNTGNNSFKSSLETFCKWRGAQVVWDYFLQYQRQHSRHQGMRISPKIFSPNTFSWRAVGVKETSHRDAVLCWITAMQTNTPLLKHQLSHQCSDSSSPNKKAPRHFLSNSRDPSLDCHFYSVPS